ncbi:hypothetical protein KKE74_01480 [Patescibacteria group bacterium]|nr:hypothetical protein [Patescibacteria group bacterium]MBU2472684.1 hypothetical protein [Patescibacteria group bacterium]
MRTAFFKIYDNLSQYSFNFNYGESIFPFKVISLIISALFIAIIIFLLIKIRKDIEKFLGQAVESIAAPGLPKREMNKSWQIVLDKLESVEKDSYKMAVIEADKIFDDIIKRIGYKGDDMGERLKQINPAQIANIDEIWQAHKLRNRLVHEPGFQINQFQAKRSIEIYQRAMEDLGAF